MKKHWKKVVNSAGENVLIQHIRRLLHPFPTDKLEYGHFAYAAVITVRVGRKH